MAEQKTTPMLTEIGASALLVFRHIDRMSEDLTGTLSVTKESADKLMTFSLQIRFFEALIIAELDKEYYKAYRERVKPLIDKIPLSFSWKDIRAKQLFMIAYVKWLKLLILQARKKGYLGKKKLGYGLE